MRPRHKGTVGAGLIHCFAMKPRTLILRTAGTNCDVELAHAFRRAGATTESIHLNVVLAEPDVLERFDILGFPGGFSYGDDIAAGRILANRLKHRLLPGLRSFVAAGKPIIGICNGFQVLVKLGLLPDFDPTSDQAPSQTVTLADNTVPRFINRWVDLRAEAGSPCIWTRGLDALSLCIAHGEGRFVAADDVLDRLVADGQVALRYVDNPNGSMRDIAGICDPSGLIFGLMPHPERFSDPTNDPQWTRRRGEAVGLKIFTNAVEHVAAHETLTR